MTLCQTEEQLAALERYVLRADRKNTLNTLFVPGSAEQLYLAGLQALQGDHDVAKAKQSARQLNDLRRQSHNTAQLADELETAIALYQWEAGPAGRQECQAYLKGVLHLHFADAQPPPGASAASEGQARPNLLSQLGEQQYAPSAFLTNERVAAAAEAGTLPPATFPHVIANESLGLRARAAMLQRASALAALPGALELIAACVADRLAVQAAGRTLGELGVLPKLTLEQMARLAQLAPSVAADPEFLAALVRKMHPRNAAEAAAGARAAFLDAVEAACRPLPAQADWLRARILYARLRLQQQTGVADAATLAAYLRAAPRDASPSGVRLSRHWPVICCAPRFLATHPDTGPLLPQVPADDSLLVRERLMAAIMAQPSGVMHIRQQLAGLLVQDFEALAVSEALLLSSSTGAAQVDSNLVAMHEAAGGSLRALQERVDLDLAPTNPPSWPVEAAVELQVDTKNVPLLLAKVYEIDSWNWYTARRREVSGDMQLAGLGAAVQVALPLDAPPLARVRRRLALGLEGRRGVWIVEVSGGGRTCRALLRKGRLRHYERHTPAGHAFTLMYEDGMLVGAGGRVWVDGKEYAVDPATGEALVPFAPPDSSAASTALVLGAPDGSAQLASFTRQPEAYTLSAGMFVDREALAGRGTAPLAVRAALLLQGRLVPLSLLEQVKLTVTTRDADEVTTEKVVDNFQLLPVPQVAVHDLRLPERCQHVSVKLTCRVRLAQRGRDGQPAFCNLVHYHWDLTPPPTEALADVFLTALPDGESYALAVRGRCGEALPGARLRLGITSRLLGVDDRQGVKEVELETDQLGLVEVGRLGDVEVLAARVTHLDGRPAPAGAQVVRNWSMPGAELPMQAARCLHLPAGGDPQAFVPYVWAPGSVISLAAEGICLLEVADASQGQGHAAEALRDATANVSLVAGGTTLALRGLPAGHYALHLPRLNQVVSVIVEAPCPTALGGLERGGRQLLVAPGATLEMTPQQPLQVVELSASTQDGVRAMLAGLPDALAGACVHVVLSRFVPVAGERDALESACGVHGRAAAAAVWHRQHECQYLSGCKLNEEVRYVLERREARRAAGAAARPGCMADRPSLLLHPWALRDATSTTREAQEGGRFAPTAPPAADSLAMPVMASQYHQDDYDPSGVPKWPPALAFCPASVFILNLKPDASGCIHLTREALTARGVDLSSSGHAFVRLVAAAPSGFVSAAHAKVQGCVPPPAAPLVDLGISPAARALPAGAHCLVTQQVSILQAGEQLVLADITSAQLCMYDSVERAAKLLSALLATRGQFNAPVRWQGSSWQSEAPQEPAKWQDLSFLARWNSLSLADKRRHLADSPCHELHFWVAQRDPHLFREVVLPLLQCKMEEERDFMDWWLLRAPGLAEHWGTPARLGRLNAAERCLLAAAGGPAELTQLAADMRARCTRLLQGRHAGRVKARFDAAMLAGSLEEGGDGGFGAARQHALQQVQEAYCVGAEGLHEEALFLEQESCQQFSVQKPEAAKRNMSRVATLMGRPAAAPRFGGPSAMAPPPAAVPAAFGAAAPAAPMCGAASGGGRLSGPQSQQASDEWELVGEDSGESGAHSDATVTVPPWEAADLAARAVQAAARPRRPTRTQEWAEAGYLHRQPARLPADEADVVPESLFWADYADHLAAAAAAAAAGKAAPPPFLSGHLAHLGNTASECALALAVLGLPHAGGAGLAAHDMAYEGLALTLTASSPSIAFHRQICPADAAMLAQAAQGAAACGVTAVLRLFDPADRTEEDEQTGEQVDKAVVGPLAAGRVYGYAVTLTSSQPRAQALSVLVPTPAGALPLGGRPFLWASDVHLDPYSSRQLELRFYFPHEGIFPQYAVTVAKGGRLLTAAPVGSAVQVVARPPAQAGRGFSWPHFSATASDQEVLAYLASGDLTRAQPLAALGWRCRHAPFFQAATAALRKRRVFDGELWAYALLHGDSTAAQELVAVAQGAGRLRLVVDTPLGGPNSAPAPATRHLEHWPIVNARAHPLAGRRLIACQELREEWQALLGRLARQAALTPGDALRCAYHLLTQDRIDEAEDLLASSGAMAAARGAGGAMAMQLEYLQAWLALAAPPARGDGNLVAAAAAAASYAGVADAHWARRWAELRDILRQLEVAVAGGEAAAAHQATPAVDTAPSLALAAGSAPGRVLVTYHNLSQVEVAAYEMDVELLFSLHPFGSQLAACGRQARGGASPSAADMGEFAFVRARATAKVDLPPAAGGVAGEHELELGALFPQLPAALLLRVAAPGGLPARTLPAAGGHLAVRLVEELGLLTATASDTGLPVAGAYVKVFARYSPHAVRFHKDGYTDRRGVFDYSTLTAKPTAGGGGWGQPTELRLARLAVLVVAEGLGALVEQVAPPPQ